MLGTMKSKHIERCLELIEEIRLLLYNKTTQGKALEEINNRLDYLKEVFKMQKEQNNKRVNMIDLNKKLKTIKDLE
jgi:hypothetical protein